MSPPPPPHTDHAREPATHAHPRLTNEQPSLDEAENLPEAVRLAIEAAERCAVTYEIVIVDDGSTDETVRVAGRLAAMQPHVRLIVHGENRGHAHALRTGIAAARQPWVLLIDADLQFDFGELEGFLVPARSADLVVGWRILPQGSVGRRADSALFNRLARAALGLPVRDADCAFRLARRELLQRLDLRADGALVGVELVARARAAGARIAEVPVHHRARVAGGRDDDAPRISARTLRELADLRRTLHTQAHA